MRAHYELDLDRMWPAENYIVSILRQNGGKICYSEVHGSDQATKRAMAATGYSEKDIAPYLDTAAIAIANIKLMVVVVELLQARGGVRQTNTGAAFQLPVVRQARAVVVHSQSQMTIFSNRTDSDLA